MYNKNSFAENLTKLMKVFKLTDRGLSSLTGISHVNICNFRTGVTQNPTLHTLITLADYFKISLDQLCGYAIIDFNELNKTNKIGFICWANIHAWYKGSYKFTNYISAKCKTAIAIKMETNIGVKYPKDSIIVVNYEAECKNKDNILVIFQDRPIICVYHEKTTEVDIRSYEHNKLIAYDTIIGVIEEIIYV